MEQYVDLNRITGQRRAVVDVVDPNGELNRFGRAYDPVRRALLFDFAFLHKNAPRWLEHEGTMMTKDGTPTHSFWTIWLLKMLQVRAEMVASVTMSRIQHVKTILQLESARRAGLDPATVLADTAAVQYATTPLIQMRMYPVPGSLTLTRGEPAKIDVLMRHQERCDYTDPAENDALLSDLGLTRSDTALCNFDISFAVSPTRSDTRK